MADARPAALLLVALVALVAAGCASSGAVPKPFPGASTPGGRPAAAPPRIAAPSPAGNADEPAASPDGGVIVPPVPDVTPGTMALATALDLRGVPYRNGGSDPNGFDCSGLVQWAFARIGRALPREAKEQFHVGREIDRDEVQPGDLLFFDTGTNSASHVGIALDAESFVHAPRSNGVVRVERYTSNYWSRRYLGARRVE
ncbi:MAG TPA: C40 family peptidase [Vicinamibacterales bacterium]|jgi:cell wall-associated NlpC family hydrolase|nr:C40 family peptidase [Vicinamibacterales bacterium]